MNTYIKLKSIPENPCHDLVSSPPPSDLFQRSKTVPPFGTRILPHFAEADIDLTSIDSQYERTPPPGEQHNIIFDTLLSCFMKDQTSETVFRKKSTSSCMNDTTHTLKLTQTVQSVSRKWQLLHFILKTLMTPELRDYETASPCLMQS